MHFRRPEPARCRRDDNELAGGGRERHAARHAHGDRRRSWRAWQNHDGAFFRSTLADDHIDVGFSGPVDKQAVVVGVLSPACTVRSFEVEGFRLLAVDANTAVLTYRARQDTMCGAFRVPSPTWVSALYVKRGGRWQNLVFQQTQAQP
ncbi:MAG TPA: nuclear transport factor 2 family protein [Caldimonas sp.]|nr:nuclear transport factor 2 family protein [Caldimonas sp.]